MRPFLVLAFILFGASVLVLVLKVSAAFDATAAFNDGAPAGDSVIGGSKSAFQAEAIAQAIIDASLLVALAGAMIGLDRWFPERD